MRVFTTIFLAETLRANIECVEETDGINQEFPARSSSRRHSLSAFSESKAAVFPQPNPTRIERMRPHSTPFLFLDRNLR